MARANPFGHWTTAETVYTAMSHFRSGAIPAKYALTSVEATAAAIMQHLAAGHINASFRPPNLGLIGIDVGFWDLDCSVAVFDRGRLEQDDAEVVNMALPSGSVERMPLPADLLLWGADVLACFEYSEEAPSPVSAPAKAENGPVFAHERKVRKTGRSYKEKDLPLVKEMRRMIEEGTASGALNAAQAFCDRAFGSGTPTSKAKRLVGLYKEVYPEP